MSCAAAFGLYYALNCTIFDAMVAPVFSPDSTNTRHGSPCLYSRFHAFMLWQVPHLCQLTPTRTSNSMSMRFSHPTCYLQDWDEIADEVIIARPRNHCVNISTSPHGAIRHKPTSYGRIHKRSLSGRKSLELTSFCPRSRPCSRHFALLNAVFRLHTGQSTDFSA